MGRHCGTGSRSSDAGRYAGVCVPAPERTPDDAPPSSTRGAGEEGAGTRENAIGVTNVEASTSTVSVEAHLQVRLLVQQVRLAEAAELVFIIAPARRNFLDWYAAVDLLPQRVGARKDVDWHLLALVFVRRPAPFKADRVKTPEHLNQRSSGLHRRERFAIRQMNLEDAERVCC